MFFRLSKVTKSVFKTQTLESSEELHVIINDKLGSQPTRLKVPLQ